MTCTPIILQLPNNALPKVGKDVRFITATSIPKRQIHYKKQDPEKGIENEIREA